MQEDGRWEQRFSNYNKALQKLAEAVHYLHSTEGLSLVLDNLVKEGLIQRFEYTHELAWNVMKDYAAYQGNTTIGGSRDATREAFQLQLIDNGEVWMDMIQSRNKTTHTYNEATANEIHRKIMTQYFPLFKAFQHRMQEKLGQNPLNIF